MQRRELVVAIDGPSGSGKSTVARAVAASLELRYLDTGAMYRALTWLVLRAGVDLGSPAQIASLAESARLDVTPDPRAPTITADGVDVTAQVRTAPVTSAVSAVAAVPLVRTTMVRRQREIIGAGGIVVEGRDIGTAVVPEAPVKVFLTADPRVRAERRARQDGIEARGNGLAQTEVALRQRDAADSGRAASPLAQATDAIVLDSTVLDIEAVVAAILERIAAVIER